MTRKNMRIIMSLFGVIICGLSVGLFKAAVFGTDPFQCLMNGLELNIPINFGTLYLLVNLILLVLIFFLDKHYIGIATFINLLLLGYVVQFSYDTINALIPMPGMFVRIAMLAVGIIVICFGSSLYIVADLGVSTYDAIALIMADKKIAKFKYCRIATDLICVVIGYALNAVIGIGTIITAFFMGPIVSLFIEKFSKPWLERY